MISPAVTTGTQQVHLLWARANTRTGTITSVPAGGANRCFASSDAIDTARPRIRANASLLAKLEASRLHALESLSRCGSKLRRILLIIVLNFSLEHSCPRACIYNVQRARSVLGIVGEHCFRSTYYEWSDSVKQRSIAWYQVSNTPV